MKFRNPLKRAERTYGFSSPKLEAALKRRAPGKWAGNLRIWDLINNYTSKQHINGLKRLDVKLKSLSNELEGAKTPGRREDIIDEMKTTSEDLVEEYGELQRFGSIMATTITGLRDELARSGNVSDTIKTNREVLTNLGRGDVEKKMGVLKKTIDEYEFKVTSLRGLLAANHFEEWKRNHGLVIAAHEGFKTAIGLNGMKA